jgi:hypothetical protein
MGRASRYAPAVRERNVARRSSNFSTVCEFAIDRFREAVRRTLSTCNSRIRDGKESDFSSELCDFLKPRSADGSIFAAYAC